MIDGETLGLLRASLREVLTGGADIGQALADLGWDDVVGDDPAVATTCLFEVQGEVLAATSQVDAIAAAAGGMPLGTAIAWPHPAAEPGFLTSSRSGGRVEVLGVTTARLDARPGHALAVPTDAGLVIAEPSRLASAPVNGIDPDVGWSVVTGPADVVGAVDGRWPDALAAARRAIASELVGVSTGMLALATAHVTSREQFGRPIGAYQSVRHRMAEAYAHVEGARATVDAAWADGGAASAAAAKAVAGRAHADAARHCLQVCGAMGLSWEFDLHRFVRRGYALDTLIGSFRQLARAHGQDLLAGSALTRVGSPVAVG